MLLRGILPMETETGRYRNIHHDSTLMCIQPDSVLSLQGWEEGMLGLQRGGRRLLIVPPQLAYGAKGAGNKVPPNATLIFDVELVRVRKLPLNCNCS